MDEREVVPWLNLMKVPEILKILANSSVKQRHLSIRINVQLVQ